MLVIEFEEIFVPGVHDGGCWLGWAPGLGAHVSTTSLRVLGLSVSKTVGQVP